MEESIFIKGARINNLKNIDVKIPRSKLTVVTGLSGSGKSSLAFDTLYAEGQRRYVESLSSYARQFLGRLNKPECDYIVGLPPAIAIEQKVISRNPRSTVGTSTEIYDYLRMLFARVGDTISPVSGNIVHKHTVEDILHTLSAYPPATRLALYAPISIPDGRSFATQMELLSQQGFSRIEVGHEIYPIDELIRTGQERPERSFFLLIDRLTCAVDTTSQSRLVDSLETTFFEGNQTAIIRIYLESGVKEYEFSKRFEADGMIFDEPSDLMFNFNSPLGACPRCEGFGRVLGIDENLVIPNKSLSLYEGAIYPWRGEKMSEWMDEFIRFAQPLGFPIHRPYFQLKEEECELLWHGTIDGVQKIPEGTATIDRFFAMLEENRYKIQYRVMMARYQGKTRCPICKGSRLKPEAGYVKVGGQTIQKLVRMPIVELSQFFSQLALQGEKEEIGKRLLKEITTRLRFMLDVGLGYLTLDRLSNTLSGGESQRINLATSLGSSLVGSLYILDEPSIGLHSRDTEQLIHVIRQLRDAGNSVVVVEHDEEIIQAADHIIEIGPDAGIHGGEVIYAGKLSDTDGKGYTFDYFHGRRTIEVPQIRRKWNNYIELKRVAVNNLKSVDVRFPLNVLCAVTGVSGSGKSTLTKEVLYKQLHSLLEHGDLRLHDDKFMGGDLHLIKGIELVDQNPIGRSSRSNPCTYLKAYDEIRKLFADQPYARQMGFSSGTFSFNSEGGRCDNCKGDGTITVSMQFMADLVLPCEDCHGKRFKQDVLEVLYRGKSIHDVLELSVDEAITFFGENKGAAEKKIVKKLMPLQEVGLGYIKLGQSSSTLSGGESQRVKLAYYLGMANQSATLFIFDEPTTGLHIHDVNTLLKAFYSLLGKGHSLIVIEHNLDVIKCADHVIDLGPEGGDKGGEIVACGTPEELAANDRSITGQYLKRKL